MKRGATPRTPAARARAGDCKARVETPFGAVEVEAGEGGLRRAVLAAPADEGIDTERMGRPTTRGGAARHLAAAVRAMRAYAAGDATALASLDLDDSGLSAFRRDVYRTLRTIPAGETTTYGDLATEAGYPGAARAVGRAMACNPWPLFVPCHRVLAAGGGLGGFGPGLPLKQTLLEHEGAALTAGSR